MGSHRVAQVLSVHERVRFRRAIRTRSATAFPTRSSTCSSARARRPASIPGSCACACETLATTNQVVIAGETRGPSTITRDWVAHVARMAIKDIGYEQDGFHWDKADIKVLLHPQSADIAQGVDSGGNKDEGAGDQGIMFGYACTRNARADAGADLLQPQDPAADLGGAPRRQGGGARARLQEPGDGALRERQAGRRHADRRLAPAPRRSR